MNDTSKNPRFVCRVARRWTILFGSSEPLGAGGWAGRHIEGCAGCQAHFAEARDFDALLRSEARRVVAPARAGLDNDIVAAFREKASRGGAEAAGFRARGEGRPRSRAARYAFAGGGMLAVGAAVAMAFLVLSPNKPAATNEVAAATPEEMRQTLAVARDASQTLWASVKPSADVLAKADPLNRELNSVVSDARSAVKFLALNFVPDASPATNLRRSPGDRSEG